MLKSRAAKSGYRRTLPTGVPGTRSLDTESVLDKAFARGQSVGEEVSISDSVLLRIEPVLVPLH